MLAFGFFRPAVRAADRDAQRLAWRCQDQFGNDRRPVLIGLSYAFKFLWSPLVDRAKLPLLGDLGRRKSWIVLCQAGLIVSFVGLGMSDPAANISTFAFFAVIGAFSRRRRTLRSTPGASMLRTSRLRSSCSRRSTSSGTALPPLLAARLRCCSRRACRGAPSIWSWPGWCSSYDRRPHRARYAASADAGAIEQALEQAGEVSLRLRRRLVVVGVCWLWAIVTLGALHDFDAGGPADWREAAVGYRLHDACRAVDHCRDGVRAAGRLGAVNWLKAHSKAFSTRRIRGVSGRAAMNHIYGALVSPLAELSQRLGWGVLIIIGFILTYALCYNIWSSFAFPFYLDYLHYTKDEVAFASKVFGIFMTMIGISLGGYLFGRIGRFPTVLIGAAVTPLGNLVYADLAEGGHHIDAFTHTLRLNSLLGAFGADDRMVRLLMAICYENIATGIALTAFVAYLSGIVSKKFTAVQYALLSSLTFLVGSLGRGFVGESFDKYGYPLVFRWTAAAGCSRWCSCCSNGGECRPWARAPARAPTRRRRRSTSPSRPRPSRAFRRWCASASPAR